MEPTRLRSGVTLSERVQDIAERLCTHAKAEIYEVLEGIAPGGEVSSFLRLEPLVNDIVAQLNDNFKQAVTKRLLPEACKLLGTRPSALTTSPAFQTTPAQTVGTPSSANRLMQNTHDNDILAFSLASGTGQPVRPDQGPPQDAVSAAASSLLLGASASTDSSVASSHLHPPESRFSFANAADARRSPSSQMYARSSYGGATGGDPDPLLFLGLSENGGSAGGLGFGTAEPMGASSAVNGLLLSGGGPAASDSTFLLAPSANDSGRTTLGGGVATVAAGSVIASPSPPSSVSSSHGLGAGARLALSQQPHSSGGGNGQLGGARPASTSVSAALAAASPQHSSSTLPFTSLPLAVRPGSSLDPGLATPPMSLPGTEPLRTSHHPHQMHTQQLSPQPHMQGGPPYGRLSGPGDAGSPPAPLPLFGGAPGPSPGPSPGGVGSQQAFQRQQQQQQQSLLAGLGFEPGLASGSGVGASAVANGGANGNAPPSPALSPQPQLMYARQPSQPGYVGEPSRQPSYGVALSPSPPPQQPQQQLLQQSDGSYRMLLSGMNRNAFTAAPDGPRLSLDGRAGNNNGNNGNVTMYVLQQSPGMEPLSYNGAQLLYGSGGAGGVQQGLPQDLQQHGALVDRYQIAGAVDVNSLTSLRGGGLDAGGGATAEYGIYGFPPLMGGAGGGGAGFGTAREQVVMHHPVAGGPLGLGVGGGTGYSVPALSPGGMAMTSGGAGAGGAGFGAIVVPSNVAVSRPGGSPALALPMMVTPSAPPSAAGPGGNGGGRSSRSGAASLGSAADSRSSSFSAGATPGMGMGFGMGQGPTAAATPPHGRRGSAGGNGSTGAVMAVPLQTATAVLAHHLHPSPPASDASGPSSAASVSTGGGGGVGAGLGPAVAGGGKGPGAGSAMVVGSPGGMSMAAKLQQVASKPVPSPGGPGARVVAKASVGGATAGPVSGPVVAAGGGGVGAGVRAPADMPGRFRCLPPSVQARIHTLTRDNHVVLLKDFDEKVLSKMTLLVDKFGAGECLAMLDRIEEVLKGKAGRLANGPGYLDVSVSTRLDELKQRASGQVTAPEDYARSTLHSRIYAELRDLIARHGFLQWHHFDQGIINMLKKMPNATALERLNELAYHSFKNVDNPKSCIVSIFTTKPKYVNV